MKKIHLIKIVFLLSAFCMPYLFKANMALASQQTQPYFFSLFYQIPMCRQLVASYEVETERYDLLRPVHQASLPLQYSLHESVPEEYIPLFYEEAASWNNIAGDEMVRINAEIDREPFDPQANGLDGKNVIYVIDQEDYVHILNAPHNNIKEGPSALIPGISNITPLKTNLPQSAPFVPIFDTDIIIREEALTDIGFYRHQLFTHMKRLGIEGDFHNEHIEVIRSAIVNHIIDMSDEDVKDLLIKDLEAQKATIRDQDRDPSLLDEVDQIIAETQSMSHQRTRQVKINLANNLLSGDMDTMESQSSIVLQNIIRHEIGHGLGLIDYIPPAHHPMRHRSTMRPYLVEAYGQMTILKEIDPFAVLGLACLYNEHPDFSGDLSWVFIR